MTDCYQLFKTGFGIIPLLSLSETAIPQHLMKWLFQRFDLKIDFLIDLVGWVERSESQQPRKQD